MVTDRDTHTYTHTHTHTHSHPTDMLGIDDRYPRLGPAVHFHELMCLLHQFGVEGVEVAVCVCVCVCV